MNWHGDWLLASQSDVCRGSPRRPRRPRREDMQAFWKNLRYGARMFLEKPGGALIAVFALALGVSGNDVLAQVAAPKSAAGDHPVYRATLELTDYNLLFTRVKINGQETRALIDSGSF